MRKLNLKLLLVIAGLAVAAVGLLVAVHRSQAVHIRAALLWQADQADSEGLPQQAVRHLRRYLELAPHDLEVRARLALTLAHPKVALRPGDRDRARFVMEQVLARDPGRHDLRKALVRLALEAHYLDLAAEHLQLLRVALPGDAETNGLVGWLREMQGQDRQALEFYRLALRQAPGAVHWQVRLVQLLRRLDRGQRGPFAKEAQQVLATALQRAAGDKDVLLAAAELAEDQGELYSARHFLERMRELHPKETQLYQALARIEVRASQRAAALKWLEQGLDLVPSHERFDLYWTFANLHIDAGDDEQAQRVMRLIEKTHPPRGTLDYLQARLHMTHSRWFEAARLLEQIRLAFKPAPALALQVDLQLGQCYERLAMPAKQKIAYGRALQNDAASVAARQGYALSLWSLGQQDDAVEQFRELTKRLAGSEQAGAMHGYLVRLLVHQASQRPRPNWRPVEEELEAAERAEPRALNVIIARAELHAARQEFARADVHLERALQSQLDNIQLWIARADIAARQGESERALKLLAQAQKHTGDAVELRLARARHLAKQALDTADLPALAHLEDGWRALPMESQSRLLDGLADVHQRVGNLREACRLWRLLADQPRSANDLRPRLLLLDAGLQLADRDRIEWSLAQIKTIEGESAWWLWGQACRCLLLARQGEKRRLGEARNFLDHAIKQRESWPALLVARAELEELDGHLDQAILQYRRALEEGASQPRVLAQLVELLRRQGRHDEAERELRKHKKHALPN